MRLPDADGFCVAAQLALKGVDVVYIHDAEGAPVAVLVTTEAWRDPWPVKNRRREAGHPIENHSHIEPEMGEEVPWAKEQT